MRNMGGLGESLLKIVSWVIPEKLAYRRARNISSSNLSIPIGNGNIVVGSSSGTLCNAAPSALWGSKI